MVSPTAAFAKTCATGTTSPPLYKALYYRWSAPLKLKPNSFGGFGAAIPLATRGYYGGYG